MNDAQNDTRLAARKLLSTYADMEEMVRLGAYKAGSSEEVDDAVALAPQIEALINQGKHERGNSDADFATLAAIIGGEALADEPLGVAA
jgi:flagellum-specific ATP synthase